MVKRNDYIIANLELEKLIKQLDLGKNVDDKLILMSKIMKKLIILLIKNISNK